jgi:hypothetical protein
MPIHIMEPQKTQGAAGSIPQLGWHKRNQWDDTSIGNIADPMGAAAYRNISSYPTPTGRIEFFRDAFVFVLSGLHDKTTKWNQAVSDCLDVWEMLFFADYFSDRLTFQKWGKSNLKDLEKSPLEAHQDLAKILAMYFQGNMSEVYILYYKDGGMKIPLAGTSPYTGFFLTPNTLSFKIGIPEQQGMSYFDHTRIRTFAERPEDFQKYMKRILALAQNKLTLEALRNYVNQFTIAGFHNDTIELEKEYDNYDIIRNENQEELMLSGAIPVRKSHIPTADDFLEHYVVRLPYQVNDEHFYTYTTGTAKYLLPIKKEVFKYANIEEGSNDVKKYSLTNRLKMNAVEGANVSYLDVTLSLEIQGTERVFNRRYVAQVNPDVRELKNRGEGHVIDYKMGLMLFPLIKCANDASLNNFYSVGIADFETSPTRNSDTLSLNFVKRENNQDHYVPPGSVVRRERRSKNVNGAGSSTYYTLEGNAVDFDFIELQVSQALGINARNMIIPKWIKRSTGGNAINFAIDFGTSNTYVAYVYVDSVGNINPRSLDFDGTALAARLDKGAGSIQTFDGGGQEMFAELTRDIQKLEFVPSFFTERYQFPIRTAISETLLIQGQQSMMKMLGTDNIPFSFSEANDKYSTIITNLKWKPSQVDQERTKMFISELLLLLKCRMLLAGASPVHTKIYWMFPLSMSQNIKNNLIQIWQNQVTALIGQGVTVIELSESESPIHAYRFAFTGQNVVNIDIGGGTSDFLFRQGGNIQKALSCTFAGNALFGDRPDQPLKNGYVTKFADTLRNELKTQASIEPDRVKSQIMQDQVLILDKMLSTANGFASEDLIPFMLNLGLREKIANSEPNYRLPILFFFSALVYHAAQVYRDMLNGDAPTDIALSGNGSKVLRILDKNINVGYRGILAGLATFICKKVLNIPNLTLLTLHLADEPKAATAKGALMSNLPASALMIADPVRGLIPDRVRTQPCIGEVLKNKEGEVVIPNTFGDLVKLHLDNDSEYTKFIETFFEAYEECDFSNSYGIQIPQLLQLKKELLDNAGQYYGQAINVQQAKGRNDADPIQEPVFFYAVAGALYDLTRRL